MKNFTKNLTLLLALASSTFPAFSAEKGSTNPTGIITFILASVGATWLLKAKDTKPKESSAKAAQIIIQDKTARDLAALKIIEEARISKEEANKVANFADYVAQEKIAKKERTAKADAKRNIAERERSASSDSTDSTNAAYDGISTHRLEDEIFKSPPAEPVTREQRNKLA